MAFLLKYSGNSSRFIRGESSTNRLHGGETLHIYIGHCYLGRKSYHIFVVYGGSRVLVGRELPIGGLKKGIAYYPSLYMQSTLSGRCVESRPTRDAE